MHRPAAFPPATAPTNPGLLNSRGEEHPPTPKKTLLFQNREENPLEEQRISDRHFCTAFIPPLAVFSRAAGKPTLKLAVASAKRRNWWLVLLRQMAAKDDCYAVAALSARAGPHQLILPSIA
jgi:hypothetical protein